jgi:hypothetical protein
MAPAKHVIYASDEQVVFITKMRIERGPADVRAIKNLFTTMGRTVSERFVVQETARTW